MYQKSKMALISIFISLLTPTSLASPQTLFLGHLGGLSENAPPLGACCPGAVMPRGVRESACAGPASVLPPLELGTTWDQSALHQGGLCTPFHSRSHRARNRRDRPASQPLRQWFPARPLCHQGTLAVSAGVFSYHTGRGTTGIQQAEARDAAQDTTGSKVSNARHGVLA